MKKSARDGAMHRAAPEGAPPEGPRERLRRAFLRELPGQLERAGERWEQVATQEGDAEAREALRSQLHRLQGEAGLLQLAGHARLLGALEEAVGARVHADRVPEHLQVAVRMALRACAQLEEQAGPRAEREAAQLRWLAQAGEAFGSGVFPRR